ncbi:MAG: hypothetical protein AAFR96_08730 [Planctomycetota bacterium]
MMRSERRGGVYLLVLVSSSITMSMGFLAVTSLSAQREVQELMTEASVAAARAESGMHLAAAAITNDASWRTSIAGRLINETAMIRGTLIVTAVDEDGSLADDDEDPFTLTSIATFGNAKHAVAADFEVGVEPIEALEYPMVVAGGITSAAVLGLRFGAVDVTVSSVLIDELLPWGGERSADDIEMPDPKVVSLYQAAATEVPVVASVGRAGALYDALTLTSSTADSSEGVFVPDPRSIYVIDGLGGDVRLSAPRIVGTLVVTNARSVEIKAPRVMRPANEGLPVLLTDAPLTIDGATATNADGSIPVEDDNNFVDGDFDGVQGLIYVDDNVVLRNGLDLHGTLMATGKATISTGVTIDRNDAFLEAPPPEFRDAEQIRLISGSWRVIVDE